MAAEREVATEAEMVAETAVVVTAEAMGVGWEGERVAAAMGAAGREAAEKGAERGGGAAAEEMAVATAAAVRGVATADIRRARHNRHNPFHRRTGEAFRIFGRASLGHHPGRRCCWRGKHRCCRCTCWCTRRRPRCPCT